MPIHDDCMSQDRLNKAQNGHVEPLRSQFRKVHHITSAIYLGRTELARPAPLKSDGRQTIWRRKASSSRSWVREVDEDAVPSEAQLVG